MENTCRGYMIASTLAYVERTYDDAAKQKILGGLTPVVREVVTNINGLSWYPVAHESDLLRQIVVHHQETDGHPDQALERVGRNVATTAMNSFLRLLMKLMTVPLFARKATDFWSRDMRCGTLRAELAPEGGQIVVIQEGIAVFPYVAGITPGFIAAALEGIGCKNVRASSPDWSIDKPAQDVVRWDFRFD